MTRRIQSSMSVWLSEGSGGLRTVLGLRAFAIAAPSFAEQVSTLRRRKVCSPSAQGMQRCAGYPGCADPPPPPGGPKKKMLAPPCRIAESSSLHVFLRRRHRRYNCLALALGRLYTPPTPD